MIDIHCHGGGGHEFGGTVEGTLAAVAAHRLHGISAVVCSLVSADVASLAEQIAVIGQARDLDPAIVGVHLEGPFLSPIRKGAHDPRALAVPTRERVDAVLALVDASDPGGLRQAPTAAAANLAKIVRQITIAPELPGALEAIERFAAAGVVVAVGHTAASAAQARAAFDAGATLVTHAFNAMPGITAREPGPVGAALADDRVSLELIADGIHVDPAVIAAVFRAAPGRVVLVTDAMAAAGAPDGDYRLGGVDVSVCDGRAVLAGTDTLAGSTLTMDRAVEVCLAAGVSEEAVQEAATITPRRLLDAAAVSG